MANYNPTEYNPGSISSTFDSESPFDSSVSQKSEDSQKSEEAINPADLLGLQEFTKSIQSAVANDGLSSEKSSVFDSQESNEKKKKSSPVKEPEEESEEESEEEEQSDDKRTRAEILASMSPIPSMSTPEDLPPLISESKNQEQKFDKPQGWLMYDRQSRSTIPSYTFNPFLHEGDTFHNQNNLLYTLDGKYWGFIEDDDVHKGKEPMDDITPDKKIKIRMPKQKTPKQKTPKQKTPKQKTPKSKSIQSEEKKKQEKDLEEITAIVQQEKNEKKKKKNRKKIKFKKGTLPNKKKTNIQQSCEQLITDLEGVVDKLTIEEKKYNKILKCISDRNREDIQEEYGFLYPLLDDIHFNKKIAEKKEFNDTKYIQRSDEDYENIEEITKKLCNPLEFELQPHQKFVRNYLSFKTPYNSLLLYHGLGSGKTCSAISICEEMRLYSKQLKNPKRIIVVASPNVQVNFRLQLFDERKLKQIDGNWNIKSCTGNTFIKEVNPMNMRGLPRSKVIKQIKRIINNSYLFLGYGQFGNWLRKIVSKHLRNDLKDEEKRRRGLLYIKKEFSNRMIVIDEVQNIRNTESGSDKKSVENLINLVKNTEDMKLLLLSATPMFNDPREIIWLLNLMNINDDRYSIKENEVFDSDGNLKEGKNGEQIGKELLIRKSTGYISYLRGENPFTFPFKLFPNSFKSPHSLKKIMTDDPNWYPQLQINSTPIIEPINIFDLFITRLGSYQEKVYEFGIGMQKKKHKSLNKKSKGYTIEVLDPLTQILNFSYPVVNEEWNMGLFKKMYGKSGIQNCFFKKLSDLGDKRKKRKYTYRPETLSNYGRIFSPEEIPKYSGKINNICNTIKKSKGIILIYSQFIDGGCVPLALALEEMGFKRYGKNNNLFKSNDVEPLDAITMRPRSEKGQFYHANYIMITGDPYLSPDNDLELIACTNENNINGEIVKVVIVSKAGSEGLDFKNIRQVHILEPWYNFNRIEQTIGRGIRNLSHCALPFQERNVEIYLYGSETQDNNVEPVDLYMYRLAEKKAKKIGFINRILKQNAVDCLLNKPYNIITKDKNIQLNTASGSNIDFNIKDKIHTSLCDFMDNCECPCLPEDTDIDDDGIKIGSYDETFITMNLDKIFNKVKNLFKEQYVYHKNELIASINSTKFYPIEQIYMALTQLLEDDSEFITDMLGRMGKLVVIGEYYMFQPLEIKKKNISLFERKVPIDYKKKLLEFKLPENITTIQDSPQISPQKQESKQIIRQPSVSNKYIKLHMKLTEQLTIITNIPQNITSKNKKLWSYNSVWTLFNLTKFNTEFDKNILIDCAFDHFVDILNYNDKLTLINNVYFKEDLDQTEIMIKKHFDYYTFEIDSLDILVLFNKDSKTKKFLSSILFNDGNKWIHDNKKWTTNIIKAYDDKFKFVNEKGKKKFDIKNLNSQIGFMVFDKRYNLVFKYKSLVMDSNKRVKKGVSCERGAKKSMLINKINTLISKKKGKNKYVLGNIAGKKREDIVQIYEYEGDDIILYQLNSEGRPILSRKPVSINTLQLCIEIELLFRYYDKINQNGKKWFLKELETNYNKIEMVGI